MTRIVTRYRGVLVVVALAALALVLLPVLRSDAAARQRAWESSCVRDGGSVSTSPPEQPNPLVTQTGHTVYECHAADGRLVSRRD